MLDQFLNIFFFVFHSSLICFNLLGWIWIKTRLANLITLSLTAFSWFVLGIWYGFGFCPCTEWHWQVRMRLGYYDMPQSYIQFLIEKLTGLHIRADIVDLMTLVLFLLAFTASIITNYRDWQKKRRAAI